MNKLEKTAIISAIATAGIALLKFLAGAFFGSIALIADAVHSFTDIIGITAVFFGIRYSGIKTKKFPYGLYKLENLASLFIAVIIFFTAFEILIESVNSLKGEPLQAGAIAIIAAFISMIASFLLAKYKEKIGREENSPSMKSEAKHTKLDAITTFGVLIGVSASYAGFAFMDPLIGIIIAVLVFRAGASILLDSAKVLLDASLDHKTMKKIEGIALEEKTVKVKEIIARNSGRFVFVDLRLETSLTDLKKANQLKKRCEEKIRKEIPRIDKIMIDIEYRKKDELIYAVPLKENKKESEIALEFGAAEFFGLISKNTKTKKIKTRIIKNPHSQATTRKGILAAELLAKNNADILLTKKEMQRGGGYYALEDNFIEIQKTKAKTFKEILKESEKNENSG